MPTEELTLWIQHVYRTYALDDAKERFPEFDTDQDGFVTWDEYNRVAHDKLISFDDTAVLEDPEQESLRYASILYWYCYQSRFFLDVSLHSCPNILSSAASEGEEALQLCRPGRLIWAKRDRVSCLHPSV